MPSSPLPSSIGRECAAALDLINDAAEMIAGIDERAAAAEARAESLADLARQTMDRAQQRICQLEAALDAVTNRAKAAETAATEAQAGLKTIQDALRAKFFRARNETGVEAA
jgi:hypothetical protein